MQLHRSDYHKHSPVVKVVLRGEHFVVRRGGNVGWRYDVRENSTNWAK